MPWVFGILLRSSWDKEVAKRRTMTKAARKRHEDTHGGQVLGRRPIFPIDMSSVYICACHARKNLTGRLFYFAICTRISTEIKALKVHQYIVHNENTPD